MRKIGLALLASLFVASISGSALAETIEVQSLIPARSVDMERILNIAIEPFTGNAGGDVSFEAEQRLESLTIDGQPYFVMIATNAAIEADAILSGSANSTIDEYDTYKSERKCVKKNEDGKCKKHENVKIPCVGRTTTLSAQFKLSQYNDGRTIYLDEKRDSDKQVICSKYASFKSRDYVVSTMLKGLVSSLRRDLAPTEFSKRVKVLDKRKGMEKAFGKEFKASVKLTKTDVDAACMQWKTMSETVEHGSILYNLGICEERKGNLPYALSYYSRSLPMVKSQRRVNESIARVERHIEAKEQYASREAYFNGQSYSDGPDVNSQQ